MTTVLVVDDEAPLRRTVAAILGAHGYEVAVAASGEEALALAPSLHADAVLVDLGLPGIDGLEVVRALRRWTEVPIVIISARDAEADKVDALDAGADDYVAKPFGMPELLARVGASLRRATPSRGSPAVETADFRIDLQAGTVADARGEPVHLTPTEWDVLAVLAREAGRLVPADRLRRTVWGEHRAGANLLRVHMGHLRRKLEPDPSRPRYLTTEPGMGYRFVVDPPA